MGMRFTVRSNITEAIAEDIANVADYAERTVAYQVLEDTEPFVPMLTGSLVQRSRVYGNQVIYPGPYARYPYYGKLMVDPETGSAYAKKGASKVLTDKNLVFTKSFHAQAQAHWFEVSKAQNLDKWLGVTVKAVKRVGR